MGKSAIRLLFMLVTGVAIIWTFGRVGWILTAGDLTHLFLSNGMMSKGADARSMPRLLFLSLFVAIVLTAYYFIVGGAVCPHFGRLNVRLPMLFLAL